MLRRYSVALRNYPVNEVVFDGGLSDVFKLSSEILALLRLTELFADHSGLLEARVQLAQEEVGGVVQRWTFHSQTVTQQKTRFIINA